MAEDLLAAVVHGVQQIIAPEQVFRYDAPHAAMGHAFQGLYDELDHICSRAILQPGGILEFAKAWLVLRKRSPAVLLVPGAILAPVGIICGIASVVNGVGAILSPRGGSIVRCGLWGAGAVAIFGAGFWQAQAVEREFAAESARLGLRFGPGGEVLL